MQRSGRSAAQVSSAGSESLQKPQILRACIIHRGRVLEERRLARRESMSFGYASKNTISIADDSLPKRHVLFSFLPAGGYELVLRDGMAGRIGYGKDGPQVDFEQLRAQGLGRQKGDSYHIPLREQHRGTIRVDDYTFLFQFTPAIQSSLPPPQLPKSCRAGFFNGLDRVFIACFLAIALFELGAVALFETRSYPEAISSLDTMKDRWADLIMPERHIKKKPENLTAPKKSSIRDKLRQEAERKANREFKEKVVAKARSRKAKVIRQRIAGQGILAVIGSKGGGGEAVADVISQGEILGKDLDSAFEGITGLAVAAERDVMTKRGNGIGQVAAIGDLAAMGEHSSQVKSKRERRVASIQAGEVEVDGSLSGTVIAKVVRRRQRSVQTCYERELKRNPDLAGRIEVEFSIGPGGRVLDAALLEDGMGSETVVSCVLAKLRRWRFPKPHGGIVTVVFPFIFASSA